MPKRGSSFIGALKRLFKQHERHHEEAKTGDADLKSVNNDPLASGTVCVEPPAPGRPPLAVSSVASKGPQPLTSSAHVPTYTQGSLHHSISDPCDEGTGNKRWTRDSDDSWALPPLAARQHKAVCGRLSCASTSQLLASSDRSSVFINPSPRSDVAESEVAEARFSLGVQGVASFAHPAPAAAANMPDCSLLSSSAPAGAHQMDTRGAITSLAPQSPDQAQRSEAAAAVAAPMPTTSGMLLAMCPAAPHSMRRRNWCLEDYSIARRIYKGSASAVYKATCRYSSLPVALKVYFLSHVPANVVHMIIREIKIHVDLVHNNIVLLYGAFQDKSRLVLVQEYAARGDLYRIHRAMNRSMSEEQLTSLVLRPFVDALAYLHARGICHRDIKPENILFTQDHRLVIADFGVSINLGEERAVTRAGTLEYMAPEVERCPLKTLPEENKDKPSIAYTTAVDIWATGVLAYELLVGFPPFVFDRAAAAGTVTPAGAVFLAQHATLDALSFPASVSPGARDFISAALAERPEERPTAAELGRHPWLAAAARSRPSMTPVSVRQAPVRRNSSQLSNGGSPHPVTPSRLGNAFLTSVPISGSPAT